jgi:hypothetical protein
MSKIKITLNRTICEELEEIRDSIKNLDFSGLSANVERVQKHANSMEAGLWKYKGALQDIKGRGYDKKKEKLRSYKDLTDIAKEALK